MEHKFWLKKWNAGATHFHAESPQKSLKEYFDKLKSVEHDTFFVPFCGKSVDMLWLKDQKRNVIGSELSELAVSQFFEENNLSYHVTKSHHHKVISLNRKSANSESELTLYCGDMFKMPRNSFQDVKYVYDRAALVAVPPHMRDQYINFYKDNFKAGTKILLLTLEFDQGKKGGPPFVLSKEDVKNMFSDIFEVKQLCSYISKEMAERWHDFGIDKVTEQVHLLTKK